MLEVSVFEVGGAGVRECEQNDRGLRRRVRSQGSQACRGRVPPGEPRNTFMMKDVLAEGLKEIDVDGGALKGTDG